jgi:hypothetical protein
VICDFDGVRGKNDPFSAGKKLDNETKEDDQLLVDMKSMDYYNAIKILVELISAAKPNKIPRKDRGVENLKSLMFSPTLEGLKVEAALDSDFFGPDPEARKVFFQALRDRKNPHEFLGEWRARAFEAGNLFLSIRDDLKPIYYLAKKLDSQFRFFNTIDEQFQKENNLGTIVLALNALSETFKYFNTQITKDTIQTFPPDIQEALLNLQKQVSAMMEELEKQKLYVRVAMAEFHDNKSINSTTLLGIVASSIDEDNKSRSNKFFSTRSNSSDNVVMTHLKSSLSISLSIANSFYTWCQNRYIMSLLLLFNGLDSSAFNLTIYWMPRHVAAGEMSTDPRQNATIILGLSGSFSFS